ncbi:MAG: Macrolide export ATP-binding/permease protein MacB [uncultured bacterium]|nr:MAG: Macrolide export ATP-binding/permease protein MacB [uncultured bacterium]HCU71081.1 multidrug ABC transporter substrate-binding protein [Candidatus Moranbacteria bacterium]
MRLTDPVKIAYRNLVANKFRSFLTILGIIIGVGSVILIMAIGGSAQELILDQVKGVGSNLVGVLPGASDEEGPPAQAMGIIITTFTYDDFLALMERKNVPQVESGVAYVQSTQTVTYQNTDSSVGIMGVTHGLLDVQDIELAEGRFFSEEDDIGLSRIAVIGSKVKEDIFGSEDAVNRKIKIKKETFIVVGVLKEKGGAGFGMDSSDDSIFIPLKTAQKIILGINHISFARFKIENVDEIDSAKEDIARTMREEHDIDNSKDDDFSVRDTVSALDTLKNVTDVLKYFLLTVGSISLLVGGVGIMNIMLISVNQRIREVGLRKAVGAKNLTILVQFLIESATITLIGGMVGITGGIFLAYLISAVVTNFFGYNWEFIVSGQSVIIATLVSIFIGLVFGLYPARKASRISPMEALRYE